MTTGIDVQIEQVAGCEDTPELATRILRRLRAEIDAQAARIAELQAALQELYDVADDVEDLSVNDGDGYIDTMQSRTLERACSKALAVLNKEA